jgi:exonuclease III
MDPAKILIWNVRGLNSISRQDYIRSIVDSTRSDIVCIQETKTTDTSRRIILSTLGSDFSDFTVAPSVGASGGILVAWRRHIGWWLGTSYSVAQQVDNHIVQVQFSPKNGQSWWLTCVYGP